MSFMENFSTATNTTNLHMCSTDDGGGTPLPPLVILVPTWKNHDIIKIGWV